LVKKIGSFTNLNVAAKHLGLLVDFGALELGSVELVLKLSGLGVRRLFHITSLLQQLFKRKGKFSEISSRAAAATKGLLLT